MNFLIKVVLVFGFLPLAASATLAQSAPPPCAPAEQFSGGFMMVKALSGCPFSAVMETRRTQTLPDGTHIQTKSKTVIYRDSLGRIRYEMYLDTDQDKDSPDTPSVIQIYDPVTEEMFEFMPPRSHIAYRSSLLPRATTDNSSAGSVTPPPEIPDDLRPKVTREDLGTQEMDGVPVTGERTTATIPVGAQHNDQPMINTEEIWYSAELGMPLLRESHDPRSGDTEQRVTSIDLSEPNAALFQPPPDYTIRDRAIGGGN
jgi:hypothetical protein